ncbi:MAG: YhbY family RNA-binding protein [Candidatus Izemoplasmatales bacterium]|nr:YhbY family RNA-binding protein [Candidatus Izemoplasmatales bacterium]
MTLTGKQKNYLRGLEQTKKPIFQVGKEGVTPILVHNISEYLLKHELIKIVLLETCPQDVIATSEIVEAQGIAVVQVIGRKMVLYQRNPKLEHQIVLPR